MPLGLADSGLIGQLIDIVPVLGRAARTQPGVPIREGVIRAYIRDHEREDQRQDQLALI